MKEFTFIEFDDICWVVETMKWKIMDADPNLDHSVQISQNVDNALCFYHYLHDNLKKERKNS